jgi:hypothetical protein
LKNENEGFIAKLAILEFADLGKSYTNATSKEFEKRKHFELLIKVFQSF